MHDGWIGVDLDGTLAEYHGWKGPDHIGKLIQPMANRVRAWVALGYTVKIFTARVSDPNDCHIALAAIEKWCMANFGYPLPVTNIKDFAMLELWDDRAVQVKQNEGEPVGYSTRGHK